MRTSKAVFEDSPLGYYFSRAEGDLFATELKKQRIFLGWRLEINAKDICHSVATTCYNTELTLL